MVGMQLVCILRFRSGFRVIAYARFLLQSFFLFCGGGGKGVTVF